MTRSLYKVDSSLGSTSAFSNFG
uniref:Uncharacterized protein n=1 Tax=Anguilla anguilla TaxID=7936 RepID=A0A0E9R215_ANGAN